MKILYEIVKKHMVHSPCGTLNPNSPCMRDSKCSEKFPKSFQTQTSTSDDGYPKYRRRLPEQAHIQSFKTFVFTVEEFRSRRKLSRLYRLLVYDPTSELLVGKFQVYTAHRLRVPSLDKTVAAALSSGVQEHDLFSEHSVCSFKSMLFTVEEFHPNKKLVQLHPFLIYKDTIHH
ncbi:hypothetical protein EVAR_21293_1 [Eumeta japonica]|uniref:Uncharacterized protein n=1 Tax=Eumeta variegata TaxID=151549 RepID=A0A4C1WNR1_EUMVA|nr:hypothetical protein EVAR_21293_1 [Eumeta japonica]